jgi:hypothetical protein
MGKLIRAIAAACAIIVTLCTTGCLHTWTQTYQDYPPSAWDPPHSHSQGNPADG